MKKWSFNIYFGSLAAAAIMIFLTGCGGGGGGRSASMIASPGFVSKQPWSLFSLDQNIRTTAKFDSVTYYLPSPESWTLFDATADYKWISAIGTTAGLSASMSNPFKEVGVMFMPTKTYRNPGQVTFYIDGVQVGTLDLSSSKPYDTYSDDYVSYYKIAGDLPETMHTVTMVIATGTVSFDGWRMIYNNAIYDIDCSEANTLDSDTIDEAEKIRDGLEEYAESFSGYPSASATTDLVSYLQINGVDFTSDPRNPFTGDDMIHSATYSGGNYYYSSTASSSYSLKAYGGRGTILEFTENSAETEKLVLTLNSPGNHFATTAAYVTFSGTTEDKGTDDWGSAYLKICCGLNGSTQFPATSTFSVRIYLKEGKNTLITTLADPYGKSINVKRTITKDTTAPDIILIDPFPLVGPVGAQYVNVYESPVKVKAYVEKNSTATLNGISMTVDSTGVFSYDLDLVTGINTITIVSTDVFNNTNTKTYTLVYSP